MTRIRTEACSLSKKSIGLNGVNASPFLIQDWRTVIPEKFTISANGGPKYTLQENLDIGSYNVLLKDSVLYDAESETIDSALDLFKGAMPGGFAWELTELYSGKYCKFGNFREDLIFAKLRICEVS